MYATELAVDLVHNNRTGWCMPLGSAWSNGAAGVHSCGILRRLEWRWGATAEINLGTGWFVIVSQTEVCLKDLA